MEAVEAKLLDASREGGVADGGPRFLVVDRERLHRPTRGHPLAHVIRELRSVLAELTGALELSPCSTVIDYGCADMKYRDLFGDVLYLGADLRGNPDAAIELKADGSLPLADASADVVFSSQVLEHVAHPDRYLTECARVLRPGGRLLLSTHGIMALHRDPVDYWRWTADGLRRVVTDADLEVERFEGVMGLAATGIQLFQDATHQRVPRPLLRTYLWLMQGLVAVFDRQSPESRAENALVFALVAVKPDQERPRS
jgi:SAM-dependent methyltransferase